jgi:hypothetical protein
MSMNFRASVGADQAEHTENFLKAGRSMVGRRIGWLSLILLMTGLAGAQVSVVTAHNDIARTGQNQNETILTPSNVNPSQFGQLFSYPVNGEIYAQPLFVSPVVIPGKGQHNNVVYVATNQDMVYAFDGNNNGGVNAGPLWQVSLLTNTTPAGTYSSESGVLGTPVIDLSSNTMYLVSSETQNSSDIFRLHALDITTGAEKFGGPVRIHTSVPGTGSGSSGGVLPFNESLVLNRPGLLLLNGVVYVAFGSIGDIGAWHGWIFSYNATTLNQIDVLCTSANGSGAGIWMGGTGLMAEVNDPSKPYGRMFVATGNGSFNASSPYTSAMSYGMSVLDLDLTGGVMTVQDSFTPYNEAALDSQDGDLGSGGPVLLPTETTPSGSILSPLVEVGKSGMIYILDRNNLGGFNPSGDHVVKEVQTPVSSGKNWGAGIWGSPAYWNGNIYFGGKNPGANDSISAYSFLQGVLSSKPTSQTVEQFPYPTPTPSISSNGTTNGIVWVLDNAAYGVGSGVLLAYDAFNLSSLLYSSNVNLPRDNPGPALKFTVPTIANGRVFVGASGQLSVYGLLDQTPTVAPPVIAPSGATFSGSQSISITDSTQGANIYYTTNGSTPTVNSTLYAGPFNITSNAIVTAIASATGYLQGPPVSAIFSSTANAANPVFTLASGTYSGTQSLTITDASPNASIYYTVDGTTPSTSSNLYTGSIPVSVNETVQAVATAPGLRNSLVVSASYDINPVYTIDFSQGFAEANGPMQFNGSTSLDDFRLQLTDGGQNERSSAFYAKQVNIQSFSTDFVFQLSNPVADGITFTIQNEKATALGPATGGLGYQFIKNSLAIKFDIFNNRGEGPQSTGLYIDGALPETPSISLVGTNINLHSGDTFDAHITYDGTNLSLTITDQLTLASWSYTWPINIPSVVGSNTAWVGFTGSTGRSTASQKINSWTYLAGPPAVPSYPVSIDSAGLKVNGGAKVAYSTIQILNATQNQATSAYYTTPVSIDAFTTDFDFRFTTPASSTHGEGLTFVIQNTGTTALGSGGAGLGYAGIPNSVAVKFDIFNDAGEGTDSTGAYVDGATPTVPSIDLTSTGISLGSGDNLHIEISYDGTTLTWTITDPARSLKSQHSKVLNIPHIIGSNTAYIGFTAAEGSGSTTSYILDWTFRNP